jgi:hypothetical protein
MTRWQREGFELPVRETPLRRSRIHFLAPTGIHRDDQFFVASVPAPCRRANEIAEHDCQLSPLGVRNGWNIRDQRDHSRFAAFMQGGDRLKQPAAVADRGNTDPSGPRPSNSAARRRRYRCRGTRARIAAAPVRGAMPQCPRSLPDAAIAARAYRTPNCDIRILSAAGRRLKSRCASSKIAVANDPSGVRVTTRLRGRVWTLTRATWVLVSSALGSIACSSMCLARQLDSNERPPLGAGPLFWDVPEADIGAQQTLAKLAASASQ